MMGDTGATRTFVPQTVFIVLLVIFHSSQPYSYVYLKYQIDFEYSV